MNTVFAYAPYGQATTAVQGLNGLIAGDPHLDPVPRTIRVIRPGLATRLLDLEYRAEPIGLRIRAADFVLRRSAEMLRRLAEEDWLARAPLSARKWLIQVGKANPVGTGRLIGEFQKAGLTLGSFYERVVLPQREAGRAVLPPVVGRVSDRAPRSDLAR